MRVGIASLLAVMIFALTTSVAFAAEKESELNNEYWWDQFVKFFNLSLVLVVLYFILRKPVSNFFRERARKIDESLSAADASREEAKRKLAEVEAKVAGLEERIDEILAAAREEGAAEKARIIAAAERDAARILENAERGIESRVRAARMELKAYAAELALDRARKLLRERIDEEEDQRLLDRLLEDIGEERGRVQ